MRLLLVLALVLVAGCGAPSETGTQAPSVAASPSGGCPPEGVRVGTGEVEAAMGLRAMTLEVVNCGPVPFTVNGYPGLRLLGEDLEPLEVTVLQGTSAVATIDGFDTPPAPVTAAPGERLVAGLVWRNTVADVAPPVNGHYLEVVVVPGAAPQRVRPDGPLDLGTTGRLGVTAWRTAVR